MCSKKYIFYAPRFLQGGRGAGPPKIEMLFENKTECTIKHQASKHQAPSIMNHHIVVRRSARIQRRKENQMTLFWGRQIKTQHYVASKRKTLFIPGQAPATATSDAVLYLAAELEMQYEVII
jgi:hypothetical protein